MTGRRLVRARGVAVVAAIMLTGAACHVGPAAKAGQQSETLRFATAEEGINNNGQMQALDDFVTQVERRSHGQLRLDIHIDVGHGLPGSEEALLKAIKGGKYDGGWNATRAFAPAGFPEFKALEAPFLIQSYAAEHQVATSEVGRRMLDRLHGSGLTGLGLITGPLRRPFAAAHPLVQPTDWKGLTFRTYNSTVQRATTAALGARPVSSGSRGIGPLLQSGTLGGQEFDLAQYDLDGFADLEHYVTANLALWPKTYALVMNSRRYASLDAQQQAWLLGAARQAAVESPEKAFDETPVARRMCVTGVHFAYVTAEQLARLRTAVAPVYAMLGRDPTTARDVAAIRAVGAAYPGPSAADVATGCRGLATPTETVATRLRTRPRIPDGDYRVTVTGKDFEQFGAGGIHASGNAGVVTLTIKQGTYVAHVIFVGSQKSELAEAGRLRGTRDMAVFIPDPRVLRALGAPCGSCTDVPPPYSFGYTYADGHLTFTVGAGTRDPVILGVMASHPWLRVR